MKSFRRNFAHLKNLNVDSFNKVIQMEYNAKFKTFMDMPAWRVFQKGFLDGRDKLWVVCLLLGIDFYAVAYNGHTMHVWDNDPKLGNMIMTKKETRTEKGIIKALGDWLGDRRKIVIKHAFFLDKYCKEHSIDAPATSVGRIIAKQCGGGMFNYKSESSSNNESMHSSVHSEDETFDDTYFIENVEDFSSGGDGSADAPLVID